MRFNTLVFLLVLAYMCLTTGQVSYDDCCLRYVKRMSHGTQRHAVKYRWQVPDGGCNIPAVIFTMRRGRVVCTNPTEKWVSDLMKKIDGKTKNSKKPHGRRLYKA